MEKIEETLKLSPFFVTLSQEEKNDLVLKLLSSLGYIAEDKKEENHLHP